eukprot:1523225-Rhodomonas_salina.1
MTTCSGSTLPDPETFCTQCALRPGSYSQVHTRTTRVRGQIYPGPADRALRNPGQEFLPPGLSNHDRGPAVYRRGRPRRLKMKRMPRNKSFMFLKRMFVTTLFTTDGMHAQLRLPPLYPCTDFTIPTRSNGPPQYPRVRRDSDLSFSYRDPRTQNTCCRPLLPRRLSASFLPCIAGSSGTWVCIPGYPLATKVETRIPSTVTVLVVVVPGKWQRERPAHHDSDRRSRHSEPGGRLSCF